MKVLVVEDGQTLRTVLKTAIDAQPDLNCIGAVPTVQAAIALAAADPPDVVMMGIHLQGADGIEGTKQLRAAHPKARVLILTYDTRPRVAKAAIGAGAEDVLVKQTEFRDILAAIRSA